jgi:hypothetical protein
LVSAQVSALWELLVLLSQRAQPQVSLNQMSQV